MQKKVFYIGFIVAILCFFSNFIFADFNTSEGDFLSFRLNDNTVIAHQKMKALAQDKKATITGPESFKIVSFNMLAHCCFICDENKTKMITISYYSCSQKQTTLIFEKLKSAYGTNFKTAGRYTDWIKDGKIIRFDLLRINKSRQDITVAIIDELWAKKHKFR